LLWFYIFFELSLAPLVAFIGIFGSRAGAKIQAIYKLYFFTLVFSFPFLLTILRIYKLYFFLDFDFIFYLLKYGISTSEYLFYSFSFFLAFIVKLPLCPFHLWLPEAHVEAPTGGSVLLAGILLKLGAYGLLRFNFAVFNLLETFELFFYAWAFFSFLYAALISFVQEDQKRSIAYSSVAHMSFFLLGLLALNEQGTFGALFLLFSHAFISSALFLLAGSVYDRFKSRIHSYWEGGFVLMPLFSFFSLFFSLANIGFPGCTSFIAELVIVNAYPQIGPEFTVAIAFSAFLSLLYTFHGIYVPSTETVTESIVHYTDLDNLEVFSLFFLFFLTLVLGLFPGFFLQPFLVFK